MYNFIRANDTNGYPRSFKIYKNFKIELYDVKKSLKNIYGKIKITKK